MVYSYKGFKKVCVGGYILSLLKKIQSHVKEYANIIAGVIECGVEIVDDDMVRIAGTGAFEKKENQKSKGAIYKDVLINGESHVVENPSKHPLCSDCEFKEKCKEKLEISAPIFYDEKVVGVIGLVALTERTKLKVLRNINSHLRFTEQISDFISTKIAENEGAVEKKERINILSQIINDFGKSVLVIEEDGKIIEANSRAIRELKIQTDFKNTPTHINIASENEMVFGKELFSAEIEERKYELVGVFFPVSSSFFTDKEYKIFIFNKYIRTE